MTSRPNNELPGKPLQGIPGKETPKEGDVGVSRLTVSFDLLCG